MQVVPRPCGQHCSHIWSPAVYSPAPSQSVLSDTPDVLVYLVSQNPSITSSRTQLEFTTNRTSSTRKKVQPPDPNPSSIYPQITCNSSNPALPPCPLPALLCNANLHPRISRPHSPCSPSPPSSSSASSVKSSPTIASSSSRSARTATRSRTRVAGSTSRSRSSFGCAPSR